MKTVHKYKGLTWIDLESPTTEEVRSIMSEYGIDPLVGEELLTPTVRPKVDLYQNLIYMILHFPGLAHMARSTREIDFVIGKEFIVTTHYGPIEFFDELKKSFEVNAILDRDAIGNHAGYIFFHMIRGLYRSLSYELEYIRNSLLDVEHRIYHGEERAMVIELSKINRTLLSFKEATDIHKEVLHSFEIAGKRFFGDDFEYHIRSILGEYYKIESSVMGSKEYLTELRDTNDSLLTTKQNETMKTLTVVAFVFLPLSLIAAVFGMSMEKPLIHTDQDFTIVLSSMIIVGFGLFIYFKTKKLI